MHCDVFWTQKERCMSSLPSLVRIPFQLLKVISKCDAIVEPLIKMVAFDTALKLI